MKKLTIPVVLLLVALIIVSGRVITVETVAAETVVAPNYFPLQVGNEWNYLRTSQVINEKLLVKVTGKMQPPGSTTVFYQLNNYNGQAHFVTQNSTGMVYEYPNLEWYFLNAEVGKSWTMRINTNTPGVIPGSDGALLTVVSRNEVVRVSAGVFTAVHIRFQTRVMDAGITDEWFVPGVGLVKRMESSFVGAITTELVRAVINGVVIGNP